jgi:hypothetical protein
MPQSGAPLISIEEAQAAGCISVVTTVPGTVPCKAGACTCDGDARRVINGVALVAEFYTIA